MAVGFRGMPWDMLALAKMDSFGNRGIPWAAVGIHGIAWEKLNSPWDFVGWPWDVVGLPLEIMG